jgi:catechol 2,3-dioxygenase
MAPHEPEKVAATPPDPEEAAARGAPALAAIHPETAMGPVHLTVSDLERSVTFYERVIGMTLRQRSNGSATLGCDADLLVLGEDPGAPPADGYCGLFHFALLVPTRIDLARWLAHAARDRVPLTGLADHYVSEAIYLDDPDGHGIEIYWDRPREVWEGRVAQRMTTLPLDTRDLLGELGDAPAERFEGLPGTTVMGHVHLRVAAVAPTVGFYRDVLGFALMAQLGSSAAFLSAGGYHHHLGANIWQSPAADRAPAGTARLELATIVLPDPQAQDRLLGRVAAAGHEQEITPSGVRVHDPSGIPVELRIGSGGFP